MKIWHPYTQHFYSSDLPEIEYARGAYLHTKDSRRILDAISSWWVNIHGHCHPHIVQAIANQAARLEQVIFAGFTHEPAERLALELGKWLPKELQTLFFSDNGSTSVEVALKMALGFFHHRGENRKKVIALEGAYHGDTFGAMAVGARGGFHRPYESHLFEVIRVPCNDPAVLEKVFQKNPDVAALIVEPLVLGAGGMQMYPSEILRKMAQLCRDAGSLFIADEVMTGFGRTGTFLACEQADIVPDLVCLSKGITGGFLPLGVTLARQEIYDGFYSADRNRTFFHGHSYTANPIACAAAVASLEVFKSEESLSRVRRMSDWHSKRLAKLAEHPGISSTRVCGSIAAMDLAVSDSGYLSQIGPELYREFLAEGVLLRPLGNVVYLLPPYCVTENDINEVYDVIEKCISRSL